MNEYPLITAATIVTFVTLVLSLLKSFGLAMTPDQEVNLLKLFAFAAPWVVVLIGHWKTTPLAAPKDETGQPLVRAVDGMPTKAQVRANAKADK